MATKVICVAWQLSVVFKDKHATPCLVEIESLLGKIGCYCLLYRKKMEVFSCVALFFLIVVF